MGLAARGRRMADGMKPDLAFRMEGEPPRRTLQASRGARMGHDGRVHFYTRTPAREEAARMVWRFRSGLPPGWAARPPSGPVRVRVELVYPLRRKDRARGEALLPHFERPDADNLVKSLLDSMTRAGVWEDDGQVHDLRVRKWRGGVPVGRCSFGSGWRRRMGRMGRMGRSRGRSFDRRRKRPAAR